MSWGQFSHHEEAEESFWPSFTDIMMVIVMTFLLVTVAVVMTNTRLLDELKSSLVAEQEASQLAEFTLQENATLEEQLDYFRQRSSSLEMDLLRSMAKQEATQTELTNTRTELSRLQMQEQTQARTLEQRNQELSVLQQDYREQSAASSRLQATLAQTQQQLEEETGRLEQEKAQLQAQMLEEKTALQLELSEAKQALSSETQRLQTELQLVNQQLQASQESQQASEQALITLQNKTVDEREKLASLEGDYAELDKKYQKLLKPKRSSKGKTSVDVMYSRSGYKIRAPGDSTYRNVRKAEMEAELEALKAQYVSDLYVKIIIPENSGLSYNEAWVFTRDTLNKYDYYYQQDNSETPEDGAVEE